MEIARVVAVITVCRSAGHAVLVAEPPVWGTMRPWQVPVAPVTDGR